MRIKEEVRLSFIPGRYKPYLLIFSPPASLKGENAKNTIYSTFPRHRIIGALHIGNTC